MSPKDAPDRERYDVVVVGAGVAGSLLAKQLGERGHRVLVLEAGVGSAGAAGDAAGERVSAVRRFQQAAAKVPSSALAPNPLVPSPKCSTSPVWPRAVTGRAGTSSRTGRCRTPAATCGSTAALGPPGPG